jgi:hypothetical protein
MATIKHHQPGYMGAKEEFIGNGSLQGIHTLIMGLSHALLNMYAENELIAIPMRRTAGIGCADKMDLE